MKLDPTDLRYLSDDVFRTLTAVEMGSKNHEVVPSGLIAQISNIRTGGVNKCLGELAKRNLVARVAGAKYDGYRLTYGGYDFLAMRTLARRQSVYSVGNQIGVGKESDIYVVADEEGNQVCCKIHRLGRISFRAIKSKRDYLRKGQSASWMYLSRLAAMKEYAFMQVLHQNGFPVPKPVDQVRHCVVMELIDAFPLRQVEEVGNPGALYSALMDLIVRLAKSGLIHGDFNEFNLLLKDVPEDAPEGTLPVPILIDFPQMVSTEHENAEYYFNRDVDCIRRFFRKRFRYESQVYPHFSSVVRNGVREFDLDVQVAASGWNKADDDALQQFIHESREEAGNEDEEDYSEEEDEDEADEAADAIESLKLAADTADNFEGQPAEDARSGSPHPEGGLREPTDESEDGEEGSEEESEFEGSGSDPDAEGPISQQMREPRQPRRPRAATRKAKEPRNIEALVHSDISKNQSKQGNKHHGKKAAAQRTLGRAKKGSKKKTDPRQLIKSAQQF